MALSSTQKVAVEESGVCGGDVSKEMSEPYTERYETPHGDSG